MRYFDHDVGASEDGRIQALRLMCGGAAVDAYWCILERIYDKETDWVFSANRPETKSVTHWLCTDFQTLETWIDAMQTSELFDVEVREDGSKVLSSERAKRNIAAYQSKRETARQNGKKGGRKPKRNQGETESVFLANREETQPLTKEKEKEKEKSKEEVKKKVSEIVEFLNEKSGKNFRTSSETTATLINARLSEGYTVEDFKRVISVKCSEWAGDARMDRYLRPTTLFQKSKFEGYLNQGGSDGNAYSGAW